LVEERRAVETAGRRGGCGVVVRRSWGAELGDADSRRASELFFPWGAEGRRHKWRMESGGAAAKAELEDDAVRSSGVAERCPLASGEARGGGEGGASGTAGRLRSGRR
jgi:hypothetical protein